MTFFIILQIKLACHQATWRVGTGTTTIVVEFPRKSPDAVFISTSTRHNKIIKQLICRVGIFIVVQSLRHVKKSQTYPTHIISIIIDESRWVIFIIIPVVGMILIPQPHVSFILVCRVWVFFFYTLIRIYQRIHGMSLLPIHISTL